MSKQCKNEILLEVVRFPSVPVLVGDGLPCGHPEELALLGLVSARGPEVLEAEADSLHVFLQQPLLGCGVYTGQVEAVVPAVLG